MQSVDFLFEGGPPVSSCFLLADRWTGEIHYPMDMYKTPYDVPLLVLTTYTYMSFALVWLSHEAPVDFLNHT